MSSILIVDDEIDYCLELKTGLAKAGFSINIANSVDEAIEQTNSQEFDILLVDMMLKERLNGENLAVLIKNKMPHIKTILMSGFISSETKKYSIAQGYIEKPFSINKLIKMLNSVICCDYENYEI